MRNEVWLKMSKFLTFEFVRVNKRFYGIRFIYYYLLDLKYFTTPTVSCIPRSNLMKFEREGESETLSYFHGYHSSLSFILVLVNINLFFPFILVDFHF